ncbi:4Fe-4S binding protein, partial [Eggerthella lenta]
ASPGTRSRGDAEGSRTEVSPEGTSCGARFASAIPTISDTGETLADLLGEPARTSMQPTAPVAIDLDFCKGCGICAKACKFNSITMILESEANAR